MEPRIISRPAFMVVGLRYFGNNQNQEISSLWTDFNRRCDELRDVVPEASYGLCIMDPDAKNDEFEYIAGVEVKCIDHLPEGMVVRLVPAQTYAVFRVKGDIKALKEAYQVAYNTWLPQSGYLPEGDNNFEYYDEDFKDFAADSIMYVYVPVIAAD